MPNGAAASSTPAEHPAPCPAVPFNVHLPSETGARVRDGALWKLDGAKLTYNSRAQKLCHELGVQSSQNTAEKSVEVEVRKAIEPYLNSGFCSGGYKQKFVKLQIGVPVGKRRCCDELLWDANDPQNTPEAYASAVSQALGLNWDAARKIRAAVQEQLRTAAPVRKHQ